MAPAAYLDECINTALAAGLNQRGHSATTASAQGAIGLDDDEQLAFAMAHGWVIVSHNARHFMARHRALQSQGTPHAGIIIVPETHPLSRLVLRAAMMLDWVASQGYRLHLFRWGDLQLLLTQGFRLAGYTEEEVRHALGQS